MHTLLKSIDRRGLAELPSVTTMHADPINPSKPLRSRRSRALALLPLFGALALAVCATQLYGGMPRTLKHENHHEIDQLEEAWRSAMLLADAAAMDSLLADDYMAITPNGLCNPGSKR
jgi:hypothetical protein